MRNRVSKSGQLHVFFATIALALIFGLPSPLQAQTFQTVPAMSFTMPYAGANPLPQIVTIATTSGALRFTPVASTSSGGNWLSVSPSNGGCCYAPYAVTVLVNGAGLSAGTYNGQIVFTDYGNSNNKMTVPVTLTVAASSAAFFDDLPGALSFSIKTNAAAATSQPIYIRNAGAGTLNWTLTASTGIGSGWLTASATSGSAPTAVSIGIKTSSLPGGGATAGTYIGQLLLQTSGDSVTIPVAITVGSPVFEQMNPLSFTMPFGGANPLSQILTVESTDNSALRFTPVAATAKGGNWLSVSPSNGGCCYTPYAVTVSVNAGTLPAGTYTGEITIYQYTNPQMSMTVPVTLTVAASGAFFNDLPGALSFSFKTNGTATSQVIQIGNGGSGTLNWTAVATTSDTANWLTVSSSSGTAPSVLTVGVNASLLPGGGAIPGTFVGGLLFQTPGDTTTIPVAVTVGSPVFEQVNPLSFTMPFAGANPLPQILTVESTDDSAVRFTPVAVTAKGGNWLSVSPSNGGCCYTPYGVTVSVNASTLPAGTYTGEITIYQYTNPQMSMTVPVTLTIEASGAFFDNLPGQLSFSLKKGGAATSQRIQVGNGGTGTLNWTLAATTSDGSPWLTATPTSGTAPSAVNVNVDASQLPGNGLIAGTFVGQLLFQTAGDIATIPVSVTVGDVVFDQVNPLSFTMPFGGANPLSQILTVESTDNSALRFTPVAVTAKGGNWLSVSPSNGGCCYTPYGVTVSVNASTLPAGTYTGEITIYQYTNPQMSMTIPVTLIIEASGGFFNNLPGQMSFFMKKGGKVTPQALQIGNAGSGKLKFTITPTTSDGGAWLVPSILSGTAPKAITVSIVPGQLPGSGQQVGTYVGQLLLEAGNDATTIPVTVTVGDGIFAQLNPLNFVMPFGGANPLPQILTVASNDSAVTLRFTPTASTATGGNWLSVSPSNGGCCYSPYPLYVSVSASSLKAGTYTGEITIYQYTNPQMSMTVPVTLTVEASGAFFDNLPGQTSFSLTPGSGNPPTQTVQLGNGGGGTLSWSVAANTADAGKWLKVTPTKGSNAGSYTVSVTAKSLPGQGKLAGTFLGQEVLKVKSGNVTIPVVVTVGDPVFVELPAVTFSTKQGTNPAPQTITVASTSGGVIRFTPIAASGKGGNWLSVSPSNGGCCTTPANLTVSTNASSLSAGTYFGEINIIQYSNPAQSMTVPVVLTVSP